jgi:Ser/Thr protein kinase RdoA (MazF antagonist)
MNRPKTMPSTQEILQAYSVQVSGLTSLGSAGGFSGAWFWRVATPTVSLCLRRWPAEHPSPARLESIHRIVRHVYQQGVTEVPVPLVSREGHTMVQQNDHLWELTPWMPGTADYHRQPTRPRLIAAMQLLARFHQATDALAAEPSAPKPSPGLNQRLELLDQLLADEARRIAIAAEKDPFTDRQNRAHALLEAFTKLAPQVRADLVDATRMSVMLQPCLRDIWHDHVLFTGDRTTGLVDYGAMREETVVGDVARLLASLVRGDRSAWQIGLEAYCHQRGLDHTDLRLLDMFVRSATLLSGMNWLRWIYLENRVFEHPSRVLQRIDENLRDITRLCQKTL